MPNKDCFINKIFLNALPQNGKSPDRKDSDYRWSRSVMFMICFIFSFLTITVAGCSCNDVPREPPLKRVQKDQYKKKFETKDDKQQTVEEDLPSSDKEDLPYSDKEEEAADADSKIDPVKETDDSKNNGETSSSGNSDQKKSGSKNSDESSAGNKNGSSSNTSGQGGGSGTGGSASPKPGSGESGKYNLPSMFESQGGPGDKESDFKEASGFLSDAKRSLKRKKYSDALISAARAREKAALYKDNKKFEDLTEECDSVLAECSRAVSSSISQNGSEDKANIVE